MKKYYLKKLIFLFSVSLLSSLFLGCTRKVPMPIIGDSEETNVNKNSETKINTETLFENLKIEPSKEENNNSNEIEETSSVNESTTDESNEIEEASSVNESTTDESDTSEQINSEENSNDDENNANSNPTTSETNEESNNSVSNINNDTLTESKIGYIHNIICCNHTYYLEFDDVEIFLGEDANKEFLADGNSEESQNIENCCYIKNCYYIKNSNNDFKKYILAENCTYELCKYKIDSSSNDINLVPVDFETLKNYILKHQKFYPTKALLFDINIENDTVTKISMHSTP